MPKVTLLGRADRTYMFAFGQLQYRFFGGDPQEVPVRVALELSKKMDGKKPRFAVEGLPNIVKTNNTVNQQAAAIAQNVCSGPRQLRFGTWL